jgi:hypothetical protein
VLEEDLSEIGETLCDLNFLDLKLGVCESNATVNSFAETQERDNSSDSVHYEYVGVEHTT